ncbi:MAG: PAS domain S-box protein [Magnetococcales bacterium]|nr:PAS domain S-box protein [Magnetococcales bacterium]
MASPSTTPAVHSKATSSGPESIQISQVFLTTLLAAAGLALDLLLPLGVAGGVLYVPVVFTGWWYPKRRHILWLALFSSLLTLVGYLHSPEGGVPWVVLTNRLYALITIWVTAFVLGIAHESLAKLEKQALELKKLSSAVEQSPVSVIITDTQGRIDYVNPRFSELTGYSPQEVMGKNPNLLKSGEHPPAVYTQLWQQILSGKDWRGEFLNKKKSGELYWASISIKGVRDSEGKISHFVGVQEDDTQRKQAEKKLSQANRILRTRYHFSEILASATQEAETLNQFCQAIVEEADFMVAWVEFAEREAGGQTIPVALYGLEKKAFEAMQGAWKSRSQDWEPGVMALLTGMPALTNHIFQDPLFAAYRKDARQWGFASVISLPLKNRGIPFGVLNLLSRHTEQFDDLEIQFLTTLSHQISETILRLREAEAHQRTENALRTSERRFRMLFDTMVSGVAIYEPVNDGEDFVIKDLNKSGQAISNVKREDVLGRRVTEAFPGVKEFGLFQVFQKVHRTGKPTHHPITYYTDDNLKSWLENDVYKLESGEIVAIYNDLTARKQAEETLSRYASIVSASTDHMSFLDQNLVYLAVNDAYLRHHAKKREEIVGHSVIELLGEAIFENIKGNLEKCLAGNTVHYQAWFDFSGTGRLWMDVSYFPHLETDGTVGGIVVVARDVTENKQMEDALRMSEKAARAANRAKGEFLANMSHEIRTPMNTIIGMSYLVRQTELEEQQKNYLNKIDLSAKSLLRIIDDILDISKIEAGQLELESAPFNLEEVLNQLIDTTLAQADSKGIEILVSAPIDLPRDLVGDATRLGQVLSNLCGNAIKFTERGEIVLSITQVETAPNKTLLSFTVRDTGIGMNPEQVKRLLEPFQQADASTTRRYGGTGLGLSICNNLVGMMGGHIDIQSEPGQGTSISFTARFPCQLQGDEKRFNTPAELSGLRILVVDDNPTSRDILAKFITSLGFFCQTVGSGEKAIGELQRGMQVGEGPYELILVDWLMGAENGLEIARTIRELTDIPQPPILLMASALKQNVVMGPAKDMGLAGILSKPVCLSTLFNAILNVFEQGATDAIPALPPQATLQGLMMFEGAQILLVEDIKTNQELAQEILTRRGIRVTLARNGREAVETMEMSGELIDAVLMDIQMPEMDGFEATRIIRSHGKFQELPIIAMTASAMTQDVERCLKAGMNDHIAKPLEIKALFDTLSRWVTPSNQRDERTESTENTPDKATAPGDDHPTFPDHLPGIDIPRGLQRCEGNHTFLARIITDFAKEAQGLYKTLAEALNQEDTETALSLAHGLKGSAANIAAMDLATTAGQIEDILWQGKAEMAADKLPRLNTNLAALEQSAHILVGYNEQTTPTQVKGNHSENTIDIEESLCRSRELAIFLAARDMQTDSHLELLKKELKADPRFQVLLDRLESSIHQLDHDGALKPLNDLIQQLEALSR